MKTKLLPSLLAIIIIQFVGCSAKDEKIQVTDQKAPEMEIEDATWTLVKLTGLDLETANLEKSVSLHLDSTNKSISGFSGVNRYNGSYELNEGSFKTGPLISTRMAGPPEHMAIEHTLHSILEKVNKMEISGQQLELSQNETVLAIFENK